MFIQTSTTEGTNGYANCKDVAREKLFLFHMFAVRDKKSRKVDDKR